MTPRTLLCAVFFAVGLLVQGQADAAGDVVIQNFGTAPNGNLPASTLIADAAGNLYGTTSSGGLNRFGTAFKLSPPKAGGTAWTQTVIYNFGSDYVDQSAAILTKGSNGVLYGVAPCSATNCVGSIIQLTPPSSAAGQWQKSDIYDFNYDGPGWPAVGPALGVGAVIEGPGGVLYGTTTGGGTYSGGSVFRLTPPAAGGNQWALTTLYSFESQGSDAVTPGAPLVIGPHGVLYGISTYGGQYGLGAAFSLTPPSAGQSAWTETVIYNFMKGLDGANPVASLIIGRDGVLYGTTFAGGTAGNGTVFRLTPPARGQTAWSETQLYSFASSQDGAMPLGSLVETSSGTLAGTTSAGGSDNFGTIFTLTPPAAGTTAWTKTLIHSFSGTDGVGPQAALFRGVKGTLYGTTSQGGPTGNGTVFKLAPPSGPQQGWTETTIDDFGGNGSQNPQSVLVADGSGALYGTTYVGASFSVPAGSVYQLKPPAVGETAWSFNQIFTFGSFGPSTPLMVGTDGALYGTTINDGLYGFGTFYKLTPPSTGITNWAETVLLNFGNGTEGAAGFASLVDSGHGVFYGIGGGGTFSSGTLLSLTPPKKGASVWTETTLFNFPKNNDNAFPAIALAVDTDGAIYGTLGGYESQDSTNVGAIFKLTPPTSSSKDWTETILYKFRSGPNGSDPSDGALPEGGTLIGPDGVLYGTTTAGGLWLGPDGYGGCGTVFSLTPPASGKNAWTEKVIYRFKDEPDGCTPNANLVLGKDGALYGTTQYGGIDPYNHGGLGTVFKLTPSTKAGAGWTETILHRFSLPTDGSTPYAGLVLNTDGKLYGTTVVGGTGFNSVAQGGTVFQVTP